jgi:hypothetical protein
VKERIPNPVVYIPQQHCNFDRLVRNRFTVSTVGIIGVPGGFQYSLSDVQRRLNQIGLELLVNFDFQNRQDVVDFYQNIDIQIIWETKYRLFKNPLKIINAASFGIPTVGYPQHGYEEVDGYYIKVQTIDQLIDAVEQLKDTKMYELASRNLVSMAEQYHISRIADMYKELK